MDRARFCRPISFNVRKQESWGTGETKPKTNKRNMRKGSLVATVRNINIKSKLRLAVSKSEIQVFDKRGKTGSSKFV